MEAQQFGLGAWPLITFIIGIATYRAHANLASLRREIAGIKERLSKLEGHD